MVFDNFPLTIQLVAIPAFPSPSQRGEGGFKDRDRKRKSEPGEDVGRKWRREMSDFNRSHL